MKVVEVTAIVLIIAMVIALAAAPVFSDQDNCMKCDGKKDCQVCGGSGKNLSGNDCSMCSGTGKCYYCNGTGKKS